MKVPSIELNAAAKALLSWSGKPENMADARNRAEVIILSMSLARALAEAKAPEPTLPFKNPPPKQG